MRATELRGANERQWQTWSRPAGATVVPIDLPGASGRKAVSWYQKR